MPAGMTGRQIIASAGNNTIDIAFGRSIKLYSVWMYNVTSNCAYNAFIHDNSGRGWYNIPLIPTQPKADAQSSAQQFFPQGLFIQGPFILRFRFLQCTASDELHVSWGAELK